MAWTLILIIGAIILFALAIKFLVGLTRTVISVALAILAIGLVASLMTGNDYLGVGPTAAAVTDGAAKTIEHTVNETVKLTVSLPETAQYKPAPIDEESFAPRADAD